MPLSSNGFALHLLCRCASTGSGACAYLCVVWQSQALFRFVIVRLCPWPLVYLQGQREKGPFFSAFDTSVQVLLVSATLASRLGRWACVVVIRVTGTPRWFAVPGKGRVSMVPWTGWLVWALRSRVARSLRATASTFHRFEIARDLPLPSGVFRLRPDCF